MWSLSWHIRPPSIIDLIEKQQRLPNHLISEYRCAWTQHQQHETNPSMYPLATTEHIKCRLTQDCYLTRSMHSLDRYNEIPHSIYLHADPNDFKCAGIALTVHLSYRSHATYKYLLVDCEGPTCSAVRSTSLSYFEEISSFCYNSTSVQWRGQNVRSESSIKMRSSSCTSPLQGNRL